MDVQGVSGTAAATAAAHGDIVDISFAVALLQIETIDGEIGVRLTEMEHINELRKAYNERIDQVRTLLDGMTDGKAWVDRTELGRTDYAWASSSDGGPGGPAALDGGSLASVDARYRLVDADGNPVPLGAMLAWSEVEARARSDGSPLAPLEIDRAFDMLTATELPADALPTLEGYAAAHGGTIQVEVTREQAEREVARLQDCVDNLGTDGQMGMLQLNRLLSRRTEILQLTSNIMSSDHQTAMGIIANMKV
jgi:hypothetical protein